MGTVGAFLLAVAAFVGTGMFFISPVPKLEGWVRGKKKSELKVEIENWIEQAEASELIVKGCGVILFLLLNLLYGYVVEPLAVIAALVKKIGYQPLGYAMLAIVMLSWVSLTRALFFSRNKKAAPKGTVVSQQGERIEGVVVDIDEELKVGHPVWNTMKRVFLSLPTLYLWYIFLVAIGAIG